MYPLLGHIVEGENIFKTGYVLWKILVNNPQSKASQIKIQRGNNMGRHWLHSIKENERGPSVSHAVPLQ